MTLTKNLVRSASNILMRSFPIFLTLSASSTLHAKEPYTIKQQDHQFSELFIKVKNDDVIKFVNLDSVNHRLIFWHKGQQEQMKAITPGSSQEITFSHSGIYDVRCKHHPEMKLTIFVPYVANLNKTDSIYMF